MAKKPRKNRQPAEMLASMANQASAAKLEDMPAKQVRELRRQQGLSLRALAEKSGLSANTLSLIENGKTSPSINTLLHIAIALNLPITAFFEGEVKAKPVSYTKQDQRQLREFGQGQLEKLGNGGNLQPFLVRFAANSEGSPQPMEHQGWKFIYCLSGRVIYQVGGNEYALDPGDSILFSAQMPHTWRNPVNEISQAIIVMADENDAQKPILF